MTCTICLREYSACPFLSVSGSGSAGVSRYSPAIQPISSLYVTRWKPPSMTPVRTTRDPAGTMVIGSSLALGPARRLMSTVVYATPEPGRGVLTSTGSAGTGSVATGLTSTGSVATGLTSTGVVSTGGVVSAGGGSGMNELGAPSSSRANQPVTSLYCTVTYPSVT